MRQYLIKKILIWDKEYNAYSISLTFDSKWVFE